MPAAGDLIDMVSVTISVDEYKPKLGTEFQVIPIAFFVTQENAAEDLRTFIERGTSNFMDVEVSPNPNPAGMWAVFIEFARDATFWKDFEQVISEVERLIGKPQAWQVSTYFSDDVIEFDQAHGYVELDVTEYAKRKIKYRAERGVMTEDINGYFNDSMLTSVTINDEDIIVFERNGYRLQFRLQRFGNVAVINEGLKDAALTMSYPSYEAIMIQEILGNNYLVESHKELVYIQKPGDERIALLNRYV